MKLFNDVQEGQLVMAKIQSACGQGIWCWLANGAVAIVPLTEVHDAFVPNALEGLKPGAFVRAAISHIPEKGGKMKLTLRMSKGATHPGEILLLIMTTGLSLVCSQLCFCCCW